MGNEIFIKFINYISKVVLEREDNKGTGRGKEIPPGGPQIIIILI